MMTAESDARPQSFQTFQEWLDALVEAAPADRRMLSIDGIGAQLALERVHCDRHDAALNWLSAFSHLDRTEASHRLQHGTGTRLHEPGDLRPAGPPTQLCSECRQPIVWAVTEAGTPIPLDADPNPSGSVVLVPRRPGSAPSRPLALVLHNPAARDSAAPNTVYSAHAASCSPPKKKGGRRR